MEAALKLTASTSLIVTSRFLPIPTGKTTLLSLPEIIEFPLVACLFVFLFCYVLFVFFYLAGVLLRSILFQGVIVRRTVVRLSYSFSSKNMI